MNRAVTARLALLPIAVLLAVPGQANATCTAPYLDTWSKTPVAGGNTTASNNIFGYRLFAVGSKLYGYHSDGSTIIKQPADGGSYYGGATGAIQAFPVAVPLKNDPNTYIFVASDDGYLRKINAASLTLVGMPRSITSGSCASDALHGTPTVQLAQYSNAAFTGAAKIGGRDIVMVITYHGCGDRSRNQVVAVDANDLTNTLWTFNGGEYQMDYGSEGCSLDYNTNTLYCGTHLDPGRSQNTVWAIDTTNGTLKWAANVNSVHNRPQFPPKNATHLYVADTIGRVHALRLTDGVEEWNVVLSASPSISVTANLWAEFRPPYDSTLYVTDTSGTLYSIYDAGANSGDGIIAWTKSFGGSHIMSLGSVSPTLAKIYVGLNNGTVHQLDLSSGSDEANRVIDGSGTGVVTDPTLDIVNSGTDINSMVASSYGGANGTITKEFCLPMNVTSSGASFVQCTQDSDCQNQTSPSLESPVGCDITFVNRQNLCCTIGKCNTTNGVCYAAPQSIGATDSCEDGEIYSPPGTPSVKCTKNRTCTAGACRGVWNDAACPRPKTLGLTSVYCSVDVQRGCGNDNKNNTPLLCTAKSVNGVCLSVDTPSAGGAGPCGSFARTCGQAGTLPWGGERICHAGVCERDPICSPAGDATLSTAVNNASGLAFDRSNRTNGNACTAWMSTYATPTGATGTTSATNNSYVGGCAVCGGTINLATCTACAPAAANSDTRTFTDPGNATPYLVSNISVLVRGYAGASPLYVTINGDDIGTLPGGGTGVCPGACPASGIPTIGSVSKAYPNGAPNWNYPRLGSSTESIKLQVGRGQFCLLGSCSANWYIWGLTVTITDQFGFNKIIAIDPSGSTVNGTPVYPQNLYPGAMHGIAVTPLMGGSNLPEVMTSFIDSAASSNMAIGFTSPAGGFTSINDVITAGNTSCSLPNACAFTLRPEFNFGPSTPGINGFQLTPTVGAGASPGRAYYGNVGQNGDVYTVSDPSNWGVTQAWTGISTPPWCSPSCTQNSDCLSNSCDVAAGVCHCTAAGASSQCASGVCDPKDSTCACGVTDRITSVDYPVTSTGTGDGFIRIAHAAEVVFITPGASTMAKRVDLSHPWWNPSATITNVLSVAADPINQPVTTGQNPSNDTYVEVKESRPAANPPFVTYVVQIRGDDFSARPYFNYTDKNGNTLASGVRKDMHIDLPTDPTVFQDEGRLTASSHGLLHRLVPIDPAVVGNASITSWKLPP